MKVTIIPVVIGAFGTLTKGILKTHGSWQTSGNHPNYSIVENGQNTEKSHGDLRRLAVTQTPVKYHQLTQMWKILIIIIIIIIIIRRRRIRRRRRRRRRRRMVTLILIVIRALGRVSKQEKWQGKNRDHLKHSIAKIRIFKGIQDIWGDLLSPLYCLNQWGYLKMSGTSEETCCHSHSNERLLTKADEKNSQGIRNVYHVRQSGSLLEYTREELKYMEYRTRKRMSVTNVFIKSDDYGIRKERTIYQHCEMCGYNNS